MLAEILRRVRAAPVAVLVTGRPRYGVELVVAEHHQRSPGVGHRPGDREHLDLLGPAVDEITNEHDRALRVPRRTVALRLAEPGQQAAEVTGMTMDIANHVVRGHGERP